MKISLLLASLSASAAAQSAASEVRVKSPSGAVEITVVTNAENQPSYSLSYRGQTILLPSPLGLNLDKGGTLSYGMSLTGTTRSSGDRTYSLVAGKTRQARDHYNELTADFAEVSGRRLQIIFRAYDDGAALRYRLPQQVGLEAVNILGELTRFDFASNFDCWGLNLGKFGTSHEGEFDPVKAGRLREHNLYDAPFVCRSDAASLAIGEADLKNWAGMYLQGRGDGGLGAQVKLSPRLDDPAVAVRTRIGQDVVSPWRVVMLAPEPAKLIESNLITTLNPAPDFDTSWIKPGKAAWDWWNGPTIAGVKTAGTNNETVKRFIDFAAQAGLDYMLIDEGWYAGAGGGGFVRPGVDITKTIPEIDLPELVAYGNKRGVGLWLWLNWKALDAQMDEALPLYEKLGIKGIKVDFMDRDDQQMVDWYHRLLRRTAEHKLLVNLHGAYHPTGLIRTYPHYLTQEGVLGAEYNKWSRRVTAEHNVTLAFTRLLLGPMDYTPGGFRNLTPAEFQIRNAPPFVQTTRAHGLAMYVVYESPLGVVADTPDAYRNALGFDFIKAVPVTWDETRALAGAVGDYIVVARRKGSTWYVGAMTDGAARTISVPLNFLPKGSYTLRQWSDGTVPSEVRQTRRRVSGRDVLNLQLMPAGGAAMVLEPAG